MPNASINTESPAWAIDRLSILAVKIYHMREQTLRIDTDPDHLDSCRGKLDVLLEQRVDLSSAIDNLLDEIKQGKKYMKVYRQMKMYNDPSLNPVLYAKMSKSFKVYGKYFDYPFFGLRRCNNACSRSIFGSTKLSG